MTRQQKQRRKIVKRQYYWEHRDKCRKDHRRWYQRHRKERIEAAKQRRLIYGCREPDRRAARKSYKRLREKVFQRLGNKCRCGFSDKRALQVDHINGKGNQEIQKLGPYGVYKKILRMKFPETRYQILCANCNWIKRAENKEN